MTVSSTSPADDFRRLVEAECLSAGLSFAEVATDVSEHEWSVDISASGRRFHLGVDVRDGFYCWESTASATKNFVSNDVCRIFGPVTRLLREGIATIAYAVSNPEYAGVRYPVI